ncbi:MAG: hypothetical protein ACRBCS_13555 [Cellvibrionaceae bacterium]
MAVKRFVAADMRRALELVKQEMGPDAIILSSNRVKEGVEIVTSDDENHQSISEPASLPEPLYHSRTHSQKSMSKDSTSSGLQSELASFHRNKHLENTVSNKNGSNNNEFEESNKNKNELVAANSRCSAFEYYNVKADDTVGSQQDFVDKAQDGSYRAPFHLASMQYEPGVTNIHFSLNQKQLPKKSTLYDANNSDLDESSLNELDNVDDFLDEKFGQLRSEILEMRELLQAQISVKEDRCAVDNVILDKNDVQSLSTQSHSNRVEQLQQKDSQQLESLSGQKETKRLSNVAYINATDPILRVMVKRLKNLGLPNSEIHKCLQSVDVNQKAIKSDKLWSSLLANIAHRLTPCDGYENNNVKANVKDNLKDGKSIVVFSGLQGNGKSDVVGKMASQYVLENGPENLTIISLEKDGLNINRDNKLERLSHILSTQHYTVKTIEDAINLINHSKIHGKILVNLESIPLETSAGLRTRTQHNFNQNFHNDLKNIQRLREGLSFESTGSTDYIFQSHLVLSANVSNGVIEDFINPVQNTSPYSLNQYITSCILTHLDVISDSSFEGTQYCSFGRLLGFLLSHDLTISNVSMGARLPQYLKPVRGFQLVTTAVSLMKKSIQLKNNEIKKQIKTGIANKRSVNRSVANPIAEPVSEREIAASNSIYSQAALDSRALQQVALP